MEPQDEESLRKLPDRELLIRTAIAVHDIKPKVEALEKWRDHVHWAGGTVAALFGAGLLNLHNLVHHVADRFGGKP